WKNHSNGEMGNGQTLDFKQEKSSLKHYTFKNQKYSRIIGVKTNLPVTFRDLASVIKIETIRFQFSKMVHKK
ncbi:hypothetical protein ACYSNX_12600, partial [Myroides sp. LJL115]